MRELRIIRREGSNDPALTSYIDIARACYDESHELEWNFDDPVLLVWGDWQDGRRIGYLAYIATVRDRPYWRVWSITRIDFALAKAVTFVHDGQSMKDLNAMASLFSDESKKNGIHHEVFPLLDFETTVLAGNVALLTGDGYRWCDRKGAELKGITF